jgi:hypothetical protein
MDLRTNRTARRALTGLAAVVALAAPAQASAAGAGVGNGVLGVTSGRDATQITVTKLAGSLVVDNGTQPLAPSSGCTASGPNRVTCPSSRVVGIVATLGDGDDNFDSSAVALPTGVNGGNGNDRIATGAAVDSIDGSAGNDVFSTRDGVFDMVTCGTGSDSGTVDLDDRLSADCEAQVQRSVPSPGGSTAGAAEPTIPAPPDPGVTAEDPAGTSDDPAPTDPGAIDDPPASADDPASPPAVDAPIAISAPSAITLSASGEMTVGLSCTADTGTCRGTVQLVEVNGTIKARTLVRDAGNHNAAKKGAVLGTTTFAIRAGQKKNVRLRLDRRGRQRIIKKKKSKTRAKIVITVKAPDGTVTTTEKYVTLSGPKPRRTSGRSRSTGKKKRSSR